MFEVKFLQIRRVNVRQDSARAERAVQYERAKTRKERDRWWSLKVFGSYHGLKHATREREELEHWTCSQKLEEIDRMDLQDEG